jgi:hypothetical protein
VHQISFRGKNTSAVTKDVALKALAAILSSLQLDNESNKDKENENEKIWMTHKVQSFSTTHDKS